MKKIKLDAFEQAIEDQIDKIHFAPPSKKRQAEIMAAAGRPPRITGKKEKRINVRLSADDLARFRDKAEEAGLPYQTLASVILHQAAIGKFDLRVVMNA